LKWGKVELAPPAPKGAREARALPKTHYFHPIELSSKDKLM
jgi:hypothetical protein